MRKLIIAAATTAALALGMGAATAPANAQVFFGFGVHSSPYWGPGYYHPGWHHRGWRNECGWVRVWRHHHWVNVRRCRPVYW